MPKWGLTMKEGTLSRWYKKEGDPIEEGEALFEVETDKITNSVEAPATGVLFQIVVPEGETVPVQAVLGQIAAAGEQPEHIEGGVVVESSAEEGEEKKEQTTAQTSAPKGGFVPATPIARRLAKEKGIDLSLVTGTGPKGRITEQDVLDFKEPEPAGPAASPQARALAEKLGIDLGDLAGSGEGGKITKIDVLRAVKPSGAPASSAAQPAASGPSSGQTIPMQGVRKLVADNMHASLQNAAQLTCFVEFDATEMVRFKDMVRAKYRRDETFKLSFNDIIALAVCRALKEHPLMNSTLGDETITLHDHVNLGIAVALENGLIVPNVKEADTKPLTVLAREIRDLAGRARKGGLTMDEIQGGTFTITNVSMLGVDGFTPILNPPETGILGVGRAVQKPAVHDGEIAIRTMMTLSLTFDHRIVDGAPAMAFLRTLADMLENPFMVMA
jgi:pyruvate dehydrogenase E2 component (dihydrolipoamide acetyltransferase)